MSDNHPHIFVPQIITNALALHTGQSAVITLMVKYKPEEEWISERLWLVPGWEKTDLWKIAYKWLYNDAKLMYYDQSEIESVKFFTFKLV